MTKPTTKQYVPDLATLYMRVLVDWIDDDGVPEPRNFRNHVDQSGLAAMSTDWDAHCNPEDTWRRSRRHPETKFAVAQMRTVTVRSIPEQEVEHAPIWNDPEDPDNPNNFAHTNVIGPKGKQETKRSTEIRAKFIGECVALGWAIPPGYTPDSNS